jgi:hypothetical protein
MRRGAAISSAGSLLLCMGACGDNLAPPPVCPDVHYDQDIPTPAVNATLELTARISARTDPGTDGVTVNIVDNTGTVAFGGRGPIPAFIYASSPWPAINRTLFAGLGVADGVWYPFWLYCTYDGVLTQLDGEMTDRQGLFPAKRGGRADRAGESGRNTCFFSDSS